MVTILIPISVGELLDKISILQIKADKLSVPHVRKELEALNFAAIANGISLDSDFEELYDVNLLLWRAEDTIRESQGNETFLAASQSIMRLNEERSAIKQRINVKNNSEFQEAKRYGGVKNT